MTNPRRPRNNFPVPGQIVKLDPLAVPSRSRWGLDKLGVGEAVFFEYSVLGIKGFSALSASVQSAKRAPWGVGKKFLVRNDRDAKRVMVYRAE